MPRRLALLTALTGLLSLHCKTSDPVDTDSASSSGDASSTGQSTTITSASTAEPTTSGSSSTGSPTSGDTTDPSGSGSATMGSSSDGTTTSSTTGPVGPCVPLACDGTTYACGDCMDNDGDGKIDLQDSECISPCDDREDTFATGLPGDNMDPCKQDCFFDGNSGGGKGDCEWNLACDMANPGGDDCPYNPNAMCPEEQSQECVDNCQVPNNCDCFGCCTVSVDGMSYDIFIGDETCSLAEVDECQKCTKNDDCDDECMPENCEVCFGETEPPPGCEDPTCEGTDPCMIDKEGNSNCAEGYFCQTGCCQLIIPG